MPHPARIPIRRLACLPVLLLLAATDARADLGQDLAARTLPHVVTIRLFDAQAQETGLGSGFWVGGGEIVTNAHVVAGGAWAEIHAADGALIATAPYAVLLDTANDLAVLAVPGGRPFGLALAEGDARVGQTVWAFGAPLGLEGTVSTGIISAERDRDGRHLLQMTAPISSGSSGGPVVDEQGLVVGVSVGMMTEGQNLNFAVPGSALAALLRRERARLVFPAPGLVGALAEDEPEDEATDEEEEAAAAQFAAVVAGLAAADSIACGNTYLGRLEASDFDVEGPTDFYRFEGQAGQQLDVAVMSGDFDATVEVMATHLWFSEGDDWNASDDDSGGGTNAALSLTLPSTGRYHIAVRSIGGGTGAYELALVPHGAEPAVDERWARIGADDEMAVYWDRRTLARSGAQVTVWVRFTYAQVQSADDGARFDMSSTRWTFDCAGRRMLMLGSQTALAGEVVVSNEIPAWEQKWQSVAPETWAEAILESVCRP